MTFFFTLAFARHSIYKRAILIVADSLMLIFALWLSFSLRFDNWYLPTGGLNNPIVLLVLLAPLVAVPIFMQFGLYRAIIRYLGMKAFLSVFKAVIIYAAAWGLLVFLSGVQGVPRSVIPINAMVALFAIGGSRVLARWLLRPRLHKAFGPHRMVTQRHTQRLIKWLEKTRWIHKQQSHVPFAEAQVFKLRDSRLGYGRLALAMWPLRSNLASWRRANPEADWETALRSLLVPEEGRQPRPSVRKAIEHICKRLEMLSSGHENCPVPTTIDEILAWWETPPPKS